MGAIATLELWDRRKWVRDFDLSEGHPIGPARLGAAGMNGFAAKVAGGWFLVVNLDGDIVLQLGAQRARAADPELALEFRHSWFGSCSSLTVRTGTALAFTARRCTPVARALAAVDPAHDQHDAMAEDFLLWLSREATEIGWRTWVASRWMAVA